jgi:DNA repair protein RadD
MIQLRPDQAQLEQGVYRSWNAGHQNVLVQLPTGGGKSVIVSEIVLKRHMMGAKQCVIAHRKELVGQMSLHVARRGIKHRIIGSSSTVSQIIAEHRREFNGRSFISPDASCSVASVDTLVSRADTLKQWAAQIDDWTIDEAHHVLASNKWGKAVAMFPNARGLGVTATPRRVDGYGLGRHADGVFDTMIQGLPMRELINIGALSDYEIAIPESDFEIDEEAVAPSGDWSTKKMREASKRSHIVGDVVTEYVKRAYGKRTICFATDVETAGEMAQRFNDAGIPTAAVSAETPSDVRNEFIRRFRDGRIWVLVNVDLFGEGFDVPAVEVVIMARPTASLAVYLQQFGRALRVLAGKSHGLVIDHVSNWKRHHFPDKPHVWTLDRREKRAKKEPDPEDIPLTVCKGCSRPYERCLPRCPYCGTEPPLPDPASRTLQQVDGDLLLLDRAMLERMRQAVMLESPASVADRAGKAAGPSAAAGAANRSMERHAAQQRLRRAIEQWGGIQRWKGRSDQEAYRRFFIATGTDVLTALTLPRVDMEKLAVTVEGWCVPV